MAESDKKSLVKEQRDQHRSRRSIVGVKHTADIKPDSLWTFITRKELSKQASVLIDHMYVCVSMDGVVLVHRKHVAQAWVHTLKTSANLILAVSAGKRDRRMVDSYSVYRLACRHH
jgi:hypothetical protein